VSAFTLAGLYSVSYRATPTRDVVLRVYGIGGGCLEELASFGEGVANVLQEDESENDMLLLGCFEVSAQFGQYGSFLTETLAFGTCALAKYRHVIGMTTTPQKSPSELCLEAQTMYQHTEDSPQGSIAFAVTTSGVIRTVAGTGDIYLSLEQAAFRLNPDDAYLGISVWGLATPRSSDNSKQDEVPLSEHPEQIRMHLVTIIDRQGRSESRLHLIEQDDIKYIEGSTTVEALGAAFRLAIAFEGTKELQQLELFRKPEDASRASVIGKRAPKNRRAT
jgi:hypothetical protein